MQEDKRYEISDGRGAASRPTELRVPSETVLAPHYRMHLSRHENREEDFLVSPKFLVQAILQCWKVATPIALLLCCASTAVILKMFVPSYRASAWIQINDHMPYLAYETPESELQSERYVQTQIELLRGPLVLSSVVSMPEVAQLPEFVERDDPIKWLSHQIDVSSVGESQLYQVSYAGPSPEGAAVLVNAVVDQYFDLTDQNESARTHRIVDLLEQEKSRRKSDVEKLSDRMRSLRHEIVGDDPYAGLPAGEGGVVTRPIDLLQTRLTDAEVDAKVRAAELQALEEDAQHSVNFVPDAVVELETLESPEIQSFYREMTGQQELLRQTELASVHGKNDPNYIRLAEELQRTEQAFGEAIQTKRELVREKLSSVAAMERAEELARRRSDAESAKSVFEMLRERYDDRLAALRDSGDKALELELTRSELEREEKVFEMIAERVTSLRTEMRAPGRVSLWQRAEPPAAPIQRLPTNQLLFAWMGCFCLPFGIGILREVFLRKIRSPEQIVNHMPLGFVSEVAKLPYRATFNQRTSALARNKRTTLFEESVDSLRTSLMLNPTSKGAKVIAVVSAAHEEGKSSVSTQLGVSIARSTGRPTLLIDGDMRSPTLHKIFRISVTPGLAEVLDDACPCGEAIVCDLAANLDLLPAGRLHKSPHILTGEDRIDRVMDTLRGLYDFIVVDTPPILAASEGLVLAKMADETILCAMQGRTREAQMRMAYERLSMAGVHLAGGVLSGVPTKRYAYSYGTYYYDAK